MDESIIRCHRYPNCNCTSSCQDADFDLFYSQGRRHAEGLLEAAKDRIAILEKDLNDTRANLQRAYNGVNYYKNKWQVILELHSKLQKENEELKTKLESYDKEIT